MSDQTQRTIMKKRYLLVMPRAVQKVGDGYSFTLGITYVSGSLKAAGFDVFALNLNHREGSVGEIIRREVCEKRIDVVATGGLSFQYNSVRAIIRGGQGDRRAHYHHRRGRHHYQ